MRKVVNYLLYVIFLVFAAEFGLRVVSHFVYHTPILDIRRSRSDPYVVWKFNPGYTGKLFCFPHARVNRQGCLGKDLEEPKGADLIRIVAIGGSVSFGFGVTRMQDSYCSLLDSLLNHSASPWRYEVANAGVIGYSSYMGRGFVEHHLESLQPDLLVVAFGWNDSLHDWAPDKDPVDRNRRRLDYSPRFWRENFVLGVVLPKITGSLLRKIGDERLRQHEQYDFDRDTVRFVPRVSLEDFRANLEAMHQWCSEHHVKFVLVTESAANNSKNFAIAIQNLQPYHAVIRQTAATLGVPLADVDSCLEVDGYQKYYDNEEFDYMHLNRLGQLRMAQVVKATLQQSGCLSR